MTRQGYASALMTVSLLMGPCLGCDGTRHTYAGLYSTDDKRYQMSLDGRNRLQVVDIRPSDFIPEMSIRGTYSIEGDTIRVQLDEASVSALAKWNGNWQEPSGINLESRQWGTVSSTESPPSMNVSLMGMTFRRQ